MDPAENICNVVSEEESSFEIIDDGDSSHQHQHQELKELMELIPASSLDFPSEPEEILIRLQRKKPVSEDTQKAESAPSPNLKESSEKEIKSESESESEFKFNLNADDYEYKNKNEDFRVKLHLENEVENLKTHAKNLKDFKSPRQRRDKNNKSDGYSCQIGKTDAVQNAGGMEKMADKTEDGQAKNSSNNDEDLKLWLMLLFGLILGFLLHAHLSLIRTSGGQQPENLKETIRKIVLEHLDSLKAINFDHAKNCKVADLKVMSCGNAMEILPSPPPRKQTIYPYGNGNVKSNKKVEVLCDFEVDGGGWTIIQKRSSGPQQEFNRTWNEYAEGFGSVDGNFWLGLENIHALTQNEDQELRIELEDFEGKKKYAKYMHFSVSDASDFYRLLVSGFSGNGGNSLKDNSGLMFSTVDKDNSEGFGNCAADRGGGWWFKYCGGQGLLNGLYREEGESYPKWTGILWASWKGESYSLAKTQMMIRKRK